MKKRLMALLCLLLALMQCTSAMAGLTLPASLTEIQEEAFEGDASIGGVVELPNGVTHIGAEAFKDTGVYAMWMPSSVGYIGSNVLQNTGAVYAVVPSGHVEMADDALAGVGCILTVPGSNVANWADSNGVECYHFYEYKWHDGFCYAYSDASMEARLLFARNTGKSGSVTIPAYMDSFRVTEVGPYAFTRLNGVTEINLPDTVQGSVAEGISWPDAPVNFYRVGSDMEIPEGAGELPMNESYKVLNVGDERDFWVEEVPANEQSRTWTSSNNQVVTVDENGRVQAVGLGSATVQAVVDCGEFGVFYARCDIEVRVPMIGITVLEDMVSIPVGRHETIQFNIVCDGLYENTGLHISSDDDSVVTADGSGGFVGVAPGCATVTYTATLGEASDSDSVIVEVYEPDLILNHSNLYTYVGHEYQLELVSEVPETANVVWYSDDDGTATIDGDGLIRVHNPGRVTLHCDVEYEDGTVQSADCLLQATYFRMEWQWMDTQSMMAGESRYMRPELGCELWEAEMAALQVTMSSSDDGVVSFEGDVATAHRAGTAIVTARAECDGHVAETTFVVVVSDETVTMVQMDRSEITMNPGDEIGMGPQIALPDCEHFWEWTSTNDAVVSVEDGHVVAGDVGEAMIEVTITCGENGEFGVFRAQSMIHVTEPRVSITMHTDSWSVPVGRLVDVGFDYEIDGLEENLMVYFESDDPSIVDPDTQIAQTVGSTTVYYVLDLHGVQDRGAVQIEVYEPQFALNYSNFYTFPGFEDQLSVEGELPEGAYVEWQSTDEGVFTIDNEGRLTAHNPGSAYAVCWLHNEDGSIQSADCMVIVNEWLLEWNRYNEFGDPQLMMVGEEPRSASPHVWFMTTPQHTVDNLHTSITSSDENIVYIDEDRNMHARSEGTAIITCHAEYYGRTADYEYTVIVRQPHLAVGIYNSYEEMQVGDDSRWIDRWEESEYPILRRTYTSSDENVVRVGANGLLIPVGDGEATVTYTVYTSVASASAEMTVVVHGWLATLTPSEVTLQKGESAMLAPEIEGGELNYYNRSFSSSNPDVANVTGEGMVTGLSVGTAVILFESEWNGNRITATALVHVQDDAAKIQLNHTNIELTQGQSCQLEATFAGQAEDVVWSVSDMNALRVSDNGLVTMLHCWSEHGAQYVYCTATVDGVRQTASCMVRGDLSLLDISMNRTMRMNVGDEDGLWYEIHCADPDFLYTTTVFAEDGNIAIVEGNDGNYHVKALAEGETAVVLEVRDEDGVMRAQRSCTLYVGVEAPRFTEADMDGDVFFMGTEGNEGWDCGVNVRFTPDVLTDLYSFHLESSDPSVVRVEGTSLLFGVNPGKATITLVVDEHPELTDTATAYVSDISYAADRELIDGNRMEMEQNETVTLSVDGIPEDYPDFDVFWNYDGEMLTEVTRTATSITLRARTPGETWVDVHVDMHADRHFWTNYCVNISGGDQTFWLNWRSANMIIGDEIDVWPEFGHTSVIWRSTDDAVATVDNGHVRAVGNGLCAIQAECILEDGTPMTVIMDVTVSDREWSLEHLDNISDVMVKGGVYDLPAHITHTGVNRPNVTWTSSDPEMGYIDNEERFHAEKTGIVTLTVTVSEDGRTESLSKQIVITEPAVRMENDYIQVRPQRSQTLKLIPAEGKEIASVEWRSSNESIIRVDDQGVVTGVVSDEGRVQIVAIVTFADGTTASATCCADLLPDWHVYLNVWTDMYDVECNVGETRDFWVNYNTNTTPEEMTFTWWVVDSENVRLEPQVDENGVVLDNCVLAVPLNACDTEIFCCVEVTGVNGLICSEERSFHLTVYQPIFELNPDPAEYTIPVGQSQHINWNCYWDRVDVAGWTTVSSDEAVAVCTQNGVYGVANGTATITRTYYTSTNEVVGSASVQVTVTGPDMCITPEEVTVNVNETVQLTASVDFHGLEDHGFSWGSEDEGIATVLSDGTVYGVAPGTVRIWYEQHTSEGPFQADALVTVTGEASVRLNASNLTLWHGSQYQLEMTTDLGTPDSVVWESNHGNIQVDENGFVTIYSDENNDCSGVIYCRVTYGDRTYTATCQVTVPTPTFGIERWCYGEDHWMSVGLDQEHYLSDGLWTTRDDVELTTEFWVDDPSVATVIETGSNYCVIRTIGAGETFLHMRVSAPSGESYTWDRFLRVDMENPPLTLVRPIYDQIVIQNGEGRPVDLEVQPNYTYWQMNYSSRDESIASVDEVGFIRAVNPGRTTIDVEVVDYPEFNFSVDVLILDELRVAAADGRTSFKPGESVQLVVENASWTEEDGCSLEWSQGHGSVLLDENGVLSFYDRGSQTDVLDAWVVVRFPCGFERHLVFEYELVGDQPYMYIIIGDNQDHLSAGLGMEVRLDVFSSCWENVTDITMVSDNDSVAAAMEYEDGNRSIQCVGLGDATITLTMTLDDSTVLTDTLPVHVGELQAPVVRCAPEKQILRVGENVMLHQDWSGSPFNMWPECTFTSSDETILSIVHPTDGTPFSMVGVAPGTADVTIHSNYADMMAEHTVTVTVIE